MGFPTDCDICVRAKINTHLFDGSLELDLRPVKGANPSVMLVGQDPTVANGKICSVLDLEKPKSRLYGYIVGEILQPAGLAIDNVYATDLVKCRFPDNQTPNVICETHRKTHRITMKEFLTPFFLNCQQWLFQELNEIHPKIIVSFGEPVHQLLIEQFSWDVPPGMKDAFSNVYRVLVFDYNTYYAPCIHISSKQQRHYRALWDKFIQRLKETVILAHIS
jgi:uracil-DNA glycosylase family 4